MAACSSLCIRKRLKQGVRGLGCRAGIFVAPTSIPAVEILAQDPDISFYSHLSDQSDDLRNLLLKLTYASLILKLHKCVDFISTKPFQPTLNGKDFKLVKPETGRTCLAVSCS